MSCGRVPQRKGTSMRNDDTNDTADDDAPPPDTERPGGEGYDGIGTPPPPDEAAWLAELRTWAPADEATPADPRPITTTVPPPPATAEPGPWRAGMAKLGIRQIGGA